MPSVPLARLALAGLATGAVALTGCAAVRTSSPASAVQRSPLADAVTVSQPFCTATTVPAGSSIPDGDACAPYTGYQGQGYRRFTTGGGGRLLVAVQVDDGTPDPELHLRRRAEVAFEKNDAVLGKLPSAPTGRHWVGYRSSDVRFALDERNAGDVVDAVVQVPRGATRPASAELQATIAIGDQVTGNGFGAEYLPGRPVACDENLSATSGSTTEINSTTCPGSPSDNSPWANTAPAAQEAAISPTDAVVEGPDREPPVEAGATTTLAFRVLQAGAPTQDAALALSASTTVAGGSATPSTTSLPWAATVPPATTTSDDSPTVLRASRADDAPSAATTTDVPVTIAVPAETPSGVYDVVLTASDGTAQRTATARIRVAATTATTATTAGGATPPGDAAAPAAAPAARPQILRAVRVDGRTRRVHLGRITCAAGHGACTARVVVRIDGRVVGVQRFRLAAGEARSITFRLTGAAMHRVAAGSGRGTVTVTSGGTAPVVRHTTLSAK